MRDALRRLAWYVLGVDQAMAGQRYAASVGLAVLRFQATDQDTGTLELHAEGCAGGDACYCGPSMITMIRDVSADMLDSRIANC